MGRFSPCISPLNPDPPMTSDDLFAWIALAGLMAALVLFG
jgi:hypothetical protein